MTTATAPGKATTTVSFPLKDFKAAFGSVVRAAPSRSYAALLSVKLDLSPGEAVFTSTNLELWIVHRLPCEHTGPAVSLLLTRSTFISLLRVAEGKSIVLEASGTSLKVTVGSKTWTMPTGNPDYFPAANKLDLKAHHKVDSEWLSTAIRRVVKESRPGTTEGYATSSVQVELTPNGMNLTTTNGRSFAHQKIPATGEADQAGPFPLLPNTAVQTLQGLLSDAPDLIQLGFPDASNAQFQIGDTLLLTRLGEGSFPSWRPYVEGLPEPTGTTTINCGTLKTAVEAAAISVDDQTKTMLFNFTAAELRISSGSSKGQSNASEPIAWVGPDTELAINPDFLTNMLKTLGDDTAVTIRFYSKNKPLFLVTEDGFTGFVQPMSRQGIQ